MSSPSTAGTSSIVTPDTGAATRQRELRRVELGDRARAAAAAADVLPETLAADAERRDDADAGDDDARLSHDTACYSIWYQLAGMLARIDRLERRRAVRRLAGRCACWTLRRVHGSTRRAGRRDGWTRGRASTPLLLDRLRAASQPVRARVASSAGSHASCPIGCSARFYVWTASVLLVAVCRSGNRRRRRLPRHAAGRAVRAAASNSSAIWLIAESVARIDRARARRHPARQSRHRRAANRRPVRTGPPSALPRLAARGVRRGAHDRRSPRVCRDRRPIYCWRSRGRSDRSCGSFGEAYARYQGRGCAWRICPYVY